MAEVNQTAPMESISGFEAPTQPTQAPTQGISPETHNIISIPDKGIIALPKSMDMSAVTALARHAYEGTKNFVSNLSQGMGGPSSLSQVHQELNNAISNPTDYLKNQAKGTIGIPKAIAQQEQDALNKAKEAWHSGDTSAAANHLVNYMLMPTGIGGASEKAGEQLQKGDVTGAAGTTLAIPLLALLFGKAGAPTETEVTQAMAKRAIEKTPVGDMVAERPGADQIRELENARLDNATQALKDENLRLRGFLKENDIPLPQGTNKPLAATQEVLAGKSAVQPAVKPAVAPTTEAPTIKAPITTGKVPLSDTERAAASYLRRLGVREGDIPEIEEARPEMSERVSSVTGKRLTPKQITAEESALAQKLTEGKDVPDVELVSGEPESATEQEVQRSAKAFLRRQRLEGQPSGVLGDEAKSVAIPQEEVNRLAGKAIKNAGVRYEYGKLDSDAIQEGIPDELKTDQPFTLHGVKVLDKETGEHLGGIDAAEMQTKAGKTWTIQSSELTPETRGAGIGSELYKVLIGKAKDAGVDRLYSGGSVSPSAQKVWQQLRKDGYPVVQIGKGDRVRFELPLTKQQPAWVKGIAKPLGAEGE